MPRESGGGRPDRLKTNWAAMAVMVLAWPGGPRARAQEVAPVTPNTIRIQSLERGGPGSWIRIDGYAEIGSPALSPDGRWVAFDAAKDGSGRSPGEVWVASRDGFELIRVGGCAPRWSPDGKRLLFMAGDLAGDLAIFVANRDGSGRQRIVDGGRSPDWSPDGDRIAYAHGGRRGTWGGLYVGCRVQIARADGTRLGEIGLGDCPSWSPDGKKIACCIEDPAFPTPRLQVVDTDTRKRVDVGSGWYRANWSPDGTTLVANGFLDPKAIDRSVRGMIAFSPTSEQPPARLLPGFEAASSPSFSADGKEVVFIARRTGRDED